MKKCRIYIYNMYKAKDLERWVSSSPEWALWYIFPGRVHVVYMKSLVPKRYKSIFVYSRKMQSKFEIYWEMH
jgi:hypothetical protein